MLAVQLLECCDEEQGAQGMQFLLLHGPRGCGKRTLCDALARGAFGGSASRTLRLSMAAFAGPDGLSRLMGPAPGMIGHGSSGVLTQQLRRHKHFLLVLEDLDRAHPTVQVRQGVRGGEGLRVRGVRRRWWWMLVQSGRSQSSWTPLTLTLSTLCRRS